jgi:protein involved in polysaccharide export with SLBB domain
MKGTISYIIKQGENCVATAMTIASLVCLVMVSGCVTASPEDDYVAKVLAEAMDEFPAESFTAVAGAPVPTKAGPVSIPQPPAVSVAQPPTVSIAQPPTVSVSIAQPPPASISIAEPPPVSIPPVVSVSAVSAATVSVPQRTEVSVENPAISSPGPLSLSPDSVVPVSTPPEGIVPVMVPAAEPGKGSKQPRPNPAIPTIQPESVLWVSVSEDPSLNGKYMVNDASAIDFGYVGLVFLSDMSVEQAEAELKRILEGRYLKNATVSVKLAKASYDRVGVQGSVAMPGDIKIGPGATISLSEALRRAGGIQGNRENSRVKVVRGGLKTPFGPAAEGDVYSLVTQDGQLKVPDAFLRNDDLVYVFTASSEAAQQPGGVVSTGTGGKRVVLLGEVPRRGVIEFAENEPCTLMYLLFKVGGLPRFARADKITVVRRNKDGTETTFLKDGEKLMNNGKPEDDLVLETGDRIVVPARKISFL